MLTDSGALRILCFGDSNTHGTPGDDPDYARLPADRRWTGVLQVILGSGFDVVEEGLSGRTTDVDYVDRPGCNGREYFVPCLQTHHPLDVIVIMLGTNDLKACFDRTPHEIAQSLGGYLDDVANHVTDRHGKVPAIVLVSPIRIDDSAAAYVEMTSASFDHRGVERSRELGGAISRVARDRDVLFADASDAARAGRDGLHLTLDSHAPLAELIASRVTGALAAATSVPTET